MGESTILQLSEGSRKASKIIEEQSENIKVQWEDCVSQQIPESQKETVVVMGSLIDGFLLELVKNLRDGTLPSSPLPHGISRTYGGGRALISGYFLPQLLKEFSILRELINEHLHGNGVLSFEVRNLVDRSVDAVISAASEEFARVQTEALEKALAQTRLSNQDLENLAVVAAHDLKAPMATIAGFLDLLGADKMAKDESFDKYMEILTKTTHRMTNLVDRLLQYARVSKINRPFQPVAMGDVLSEILQGLSETIQRLGAAVTSEPLPTVVGDADLLGQVLQNLIANAIKFHGKEPPKIHIGVSPGSDSREWTFFVKDNGIGFDPKYQEEIFTLYKQIPGGTGEAGAGIGLATCRKVVELHGGRIWCETQPGLGTTFFFTLPKYQ